MFVENLATALIDAGAAGVNVDIEELDRADASRFVDFLALLADVMHRHQMYLTVDVPLNEDQYDYEAIARIADAVVIMAYDEHFSTGDPGPIAGLEWFSDGVQQYLARMPREKVIVAIGAYGYDWPASGPADVVSFDTALSIARDTNANIHTSTDSVNSTFEYTDTNRRKHTVYFLDAVSAWNQCASLRQGVNAKGAEGSGAAKGVGGIAVWRLGLDDPSLWNILASASPDAQAIRAVPAAAEPWIVGRGDLFRVRGIDHGARSIAASGSFINAAEYVNLPTPPVIEKVGSAPGLEYTIALTFDDGPDPRYTGPLLDFLKREGVPAAFFVVGSQAKLYPSTLRRIASEGHLVGNHTFLHPRIDELSNEALHTELNSSQRAIESILGRQTLLFRSPYDTSSEPSDPERLATYAEISRLGYLCVGANVGAEDYDPRLPAQAIAQKVIDQLGSRGPHIVCLHDAGGDRTRTIDAVASIVPAARSLGYSFVSLADIAGTSRDELNPIPPPAESLAVKGDLAISATSSWTMRVISWIFLASTIIAIIRIVGLGVVILHDRRLRRVRAAAAPYQEPITVIVPAYNEERVIVRTIEAILQSDYPSIQILVVDDGSTDRTADVVREVAARDGRVFLLSQPNSGKAEALNAGFAHTDTHVVVVIDADTIILKQTISNLVAPFSDSTIDAVCGNVQVGNVKSLLTAIQDVEYVTCQNYDRRAFDALNCIGVVPGATGAWRRRAVLRVGGYSRDTLTEDADLTIAVLRDGGRIVYAPDAKSVTEVPETFKTLYKQRFRWAYGTFQTLWKHRAAFGQGALGWVGMPNHMIFQILFPMLAPIGDAVLIYSLFTGQWSAVASGYLTFIGLDLLGSGIALKLDRRPLSSLWTVFVQRFCHRQFMYVVTFSAAIACIRGGRHGWNKLDRTASVRIPTRLRVQQPEKLLSEVGAEVG